MTDEYAESRRRGIPTGNGITFPRWLLFPTGLVFTIAGLFGPTYASRLDRFVRLNRRKGFGFLGFGMLLTWIAGTWSVNARKSSTRLLGYGLLSLGTMRLLRRLIGSKNLRTFESLLYVMFGSSFLVAGYWKRPFDYRD